LTALANLHTPSTNVYSPSAQTQCWEGGDLDKLRGELDLQFQYVLGVAHIEHDAKVDVRDGPVMAEQDVAIVPILDVEHIAKD